MVNSSSIKKTVGTEQLSILFLMSVMAGVGIALSVSRGIERLRFPADSLYYGLESVPEIDTYAILVATVYGICVTTFIFAVRSGDLWSSPGKILALLFATMCILEWSLELTAATIVNYRMQEDFTSSGADSRGFIFGIWYRNLASSLGYIAGLPVLVFTVYKTRSQRFGWWLVWLAFLIFALLIIGLIHFGANTYLPSPLRPWYFEIAIGIPICSLLIALITSQVRKDKLDWWTVLIGPLLIGTWVIWIILKASG